jgi:DNA-binding LacI/PurR family transcriptional regulator
MADVPKRMALSDQVVSILREGIKTGRWLRELPGERVLAADLQVSRVTLRKALAQMTAEGWVEPGGAGRCHRIGPPPDAIPERSGRTVRILLPYTWRGIGTMIASEITAMTERLGAAGYGVAFESRPALFEHPGARELRRLDVLPDTAGWVLLFTSEEMERWFAAGGRPCVVMGRPHDAVPIASVSQDLQALARHAAGSFYRRGYRDLVYLIARFTSINDRLGAEAFVDEAAKLGARARVVCHPPDNADLCREFAALFRRRPGPDGIFSTCPEHCLTTLCYLQRAGFRVPEEVAVISGCDDLCVHHSVPTIAHYRFDTADALLEQIRNGLGKRRTVRITPEFVPGGTLPDGCGRCSFPIAASPSAL